MPRTVFAHLSPSLEDGRVSVAPGVELSYMDRGTGQPVVFITGWTFCKEVFEKQIDLLSSKYRIITYDPRSHGASSRTVEGNDYLTHANDLAKLLDTLEVEHPVLVGWGAGAHTALGYIKNYGADKPGAYVCIDAPPRSMSFEADVWVEGSLEEISGVHTLFLRDTKGQADFIRNYAERVLVQRNLEQHELDWLLRQSMHCPPLIAAQLFANCMFADNSAAAVSISRSRPTMYIIAEHWRRKAVNYLKGYLPEAKISVFGGRMMFWEYPDLFNQVLDDFIEHHVIGRTFDRRIPLEDPLNTGYHGPERRITNRFI